MSLEPCCSNHEGCRESPTGIGNASAGLWVEEHVRDRPIEKRSGLKRDGRVCIFLFLATSFTLTGFEVSERRLGAFQDELSR